MIVLQRWKFKILNATEKEVGPVDDYLLFSVLFFLTISTFIFSAIALFILQSNIYTWALVNSALPIDIFYTHSTVHSASNQLHWMV